MQDAAAEGTAEQCVDALALKRLPLLLRCVGHLLREIFHGDAVGTRVVGGGG